MTNSLLKHEVIKTTLPKAKELRRVAEPLITLGKNADAGESPPGVRPPARPRRRRQAVQRARPALQGASGRLPADPEVRLPSGRRCADGARRTRRSSRSGAGTGGRASRIAVRRSHNQNRAARPVLLCGVSNVCPRVASAAMAESVLVTGGAGYVGSHVVVELAQAGYAPVVLDDYSNSTPAMRTRLEALAGRPVPCINADVRDVVALRAAFHDHPIAAIVHCAGSEGRQRVGRAPARVLRRQRRRTLALVEVMGEAGVATLVLHVVRRDLRPAVVRPGR